MDWIKTQQQKPEFGELVLVWCRIYGMFLATHEYVGGFNGEQYGNWQDVNGNSGILQPAYWMKLPKPPSDQ